ncbi:zinc-finger double domain-containing protein [Ditylenchus destructor]|uniref:Zinc-finger double domain-containing protein n=1 Tax=Ditylenchus destructor TaxID=166010 RepID=A0AAD4QX70_9BILA|nr:zinc-finger double domain-containing protein [Ditylenchus destructor]
MYDMETAGEGEDEVAFFADETQLGVGEYMVVVEESHHPESELRPGSEDRYVEIDFQGAEDQNGQFVGGASTSKIDAISKNATQVMVVKDLDSEEFEDAEGQRKRKYSMKNRQPASYFKCKLCGIIVKHPSKIVEHLRIHTGERPFPCTQCTLTFTQIGALKAHLRIHNREKPYVCKFCIKHFTTSGQRSAHLRVCPALKGLSEERLAVRTRSSSRISERRTEGRHLDQIGGAIHRQPQLEDQNSSNNIIVVDHGQSRMHGEDEIELEVVDAGYPEALDHNDYVYVEEGDPEETAPKLTYHGEENDEYDPDAEDSSSVPVYVKEEILLGMKPSQKSRSRSHIPLPEECYYSQAIKDQGSDGEEEYQVYQEEDGLHIQTASEPSSKDVQESEVEFRTIYAAKRQPPSKGRRNPDRDAKDCVYVDSSLYEFAAPQAMDPNDGVLIAARPVKSHGPRRKRPNESQHIEQLQHTPEMCRPESQSSRKNVRNLDWIIDAIAEGKPVDLASPHSRRQATFHTCEHCGLQLKYPSKIAAHMRTHTKEKPFKCEICGAGFAQNTTLRMHLRRHLDQKPYQCPDVSCGQRFINGGLLNAHIQKRHMQTRRFACLNNCGKVFKTNKEREKHEQNCHAMEGKYAYDMEEYGEDSNGAIRMEVTVSYDDQPAEAYEDSYYY